MLWRSYIATPCMVYILLNIDNNIAINQSVNDSLPSLTAKVKSISLSGCPAAERLPQRHIIADRSSEKLSRHRIKEIIML